MLFSNTRYLYWLKNGINFLLFPSQERLSILLKDNKNKIDTFVDILNIYQKNLILKEEAKHSKNLIYKVTILENENRELKNILNLTNKYEQKFIHCKVVGRTIDEWYSAIILDKGINQGLKKGEIVVSYNEGQEILVGQIVEVYNNYSKVLMITSMTSNIVAYIPKRNAYGIVYGDNAKLLKMKNLGNCEMIMRGDAVFTSGLGGVFPEGIYVGSINKIERDRTGIVDIFIQPNEQIYALSFVSVIDN